MDKNDPERFEVGDVAFIGRTYGEYCRMFDLDTDAIVGRNILDCPSGAGSFVATASDRGASVTGAEIMYRHRPATLRERCRADYEMVADQLPSKRHLFDWDFYGDVDARTAMLREAHETFLDDYPDGRTAGRYVYGALPELPFATDSFSLVLSAHFPFLYGDRLDYDFHLASLRELIRVATDEVRVFPLVGLDGERYGRLDAVMRDLRRDGHPVSVRGVPFEFQKGATEMLVISV